MGGAKTVDPRKYISKPDPSRDIAIAIAMQQAQQQQMANQAQMLGEYSKMYPEQQVFDAAAQSRRAAELGMQNILRQKELERITNPQAAALRQSQSQQIEDLTAKQNLDRYMSREYMRTQGLPWQYETGLGDSTIGRAAMYDRALAAKRAYEQNLAAQRQSYLSKTDEPVGGISPATLIAARQAQESQNLAAGEAYRQGIFGNIAGLGRSGVESAMQQLGTASALQQSQQQSQQAYNQMLANIQSQNALSQNKQTGAIIGMTGNLANAGLQAGLMGGSGGTGMTSKGFYRNPVEASSALQVPTNRLGYQKPTGFGGFMGIGKQGGYY
jgi:hypothetical protein